MYVHLQSDTTGTDRAAAPPVSPGSESESNPESGGEQEQDGEPDLSTVVVSVKGTTYHGHQGVLQRVKSLGNDMFDTALGLQPEPSNPVDKNAVKIIAELGGAKEALGYISVQDIPRVLEAMKDISITRLAVFAITGRYIPAAKSVVYNCRIAITKKGKWPPKHHTNVYNSDI